MRIFLYSVFSFINLLVTAYEHTAAKYFPDTLPHIASCAGAEDAAVFGCLLLTIYLGLFINFYFQTYKKPVATRKLAANGNGVANGKANGTGFVLTVIFSCFHLINPSVIKRSKPVLKRSFAIYLREQYKPYTLGVYPNG